LKLVSFDGSEVTQVQSHGSLPLALGLVRPAFELHASSDELQLRQTVKLKRDFTFLLHDDQHPDPLVARPAARETYSVAATLYAPIHSSYSFVNSKVGDRRTVYELKRRKIWLDDRRKR
jgi:hypothetical protein